MATMNPTLAGAQPMPDLLTLIQGLLQQQGPQARVAPPQPPTLGGSGQPLPDFEALLAAAQEQPAPAARAMPFPMAPRMRAAGPVTPIPAMGDLERAAAGGEADALVAGMRDGPAASDEFPADATDVPGITGMHATAGNRWAPTTRPAGLGGPDPDAIVQGATAAAAARGPATAPARPAREALRQPGVFDFIDTALAGMAGGRPVLSTMGERFEGRNAT